MKNIIAYLMRVLQGEIKHLDNTLHLLKEKEKVLIKNNLNKLEEIVLKERELFIALRDIEDSRKSVVELFAERYGMQEKVVNLSRIAEVIGGKEGRQLEFLKKKLGDLIAAINRQNEKCAALLRKSIELTDFSIKLLSGVITSKKTYKKTGIVESETTSKKIILDYKA